MTNFDGVNFSRSSSSNNDDFKRFLMESPPSSYNQDEIEGGQFYEKDWFKYLMYIIAIIVLIMVLYYGYGYFFGGCTSSDDCDEDENCVDKKCTAN